MTKMETRLLCGLSDSSSNFMSINTIYVYVSSLKHAVQHIRKKQIRKILSEKTNFAKNSLYLSMTNMKFLPFLFSVFLFTVSCKDNTVIYDSCGYFEAEEWTVAASAAGKIITLNIEEGSTVTAEMPIGLIDTVQLQLQKELLLLQPKSKMRDIQEKQINYQLKQCVITAVAGGIVTEKYAKRGEMVAVGHPLIKIANIENMYLRIYVTSARVRNIKIGQEVEITLDNSSNSALDKYKGKIEWISTSAEFTPKTIQTEDERQNMVYAVKIAVKNDGNIKTGSYAEVKF